MTKLFSPDQAVAQLQANPTAAAAILARLDIEACRFVPTVDSAGKPPLVETGMAGFGQPVSGCLAFTSAEVTALHAAGKKAILVCDGQKPDRDDKEIIPDGVIVTSAVTHNESAWHNEHFLVGCAFNSATLVDDPTRPLFKLDAAEPSLNIAGQFNLKSGGSVTIDPAAGKLWQGHVPILPPPDYVLPISTALRNASQSSSRPQIAFHVTTSGDQLAVYELSRSHGTPRKVGLYRTEDALRSFLRDNGGTRLDSLLNGIVPDSLPYWQCYVFQTDRHLTYRLVDLHGVSELLPSSIVTGLAKGDDHHLNTQTMDFRDYLYRCQMRNVLRDWGHPPFERKTRKTIIIPAIETAAEVGIFKNLVNDAVREGIPPPFRPLVKFGVMIETAEAVANIAQIAPLCDTLCFGTNDLTAAFTKLSRCQLDHSDWMRERSYRGRSPFEVLVPEVLAPLAQAVKAARKANPAIRLNVCGFQIGGHDLPSQLAVLEMGVDCLTIPPNTNSVLRTQAAIIRHKARVAPV